MTKFVKKFSKTHTTDYLSNVFSDFRDINKRAAKIIYTKNESNLLLADKTGDVYSLNLKVNNFEDVSFKPLMGHLSMLTDLVIKH